MRPRSYVETDQNTCTEVAVAGWTREIAAPGSGRLRISTVEIEKLELIRSLQRMVAWCPLGLKRNCPA